MSSAVDVAVVGAGVVGLAIAANLASAGYETVVLESEASFGTGISSRNSEVIHSGIYYAPGSLKARLCTAGRALLYDWCRARSVAHRQCGKLVVATADDQRDKLAAIFRLAQANGVPDVTMIDGADAIALEPALHAVQALLVPSTGIIDSHGFMLSLIAEIENYGGLVAYHSPLGRVARVGQEFALTLEGDDAPALNARILVNAAGLSAQRIARAIDGFPAAHIPPLWLAKGNYYALAGRTPFNRLIYPIPTPGGLGTHLTLDMAGRAKFGPDVEWIDEVDYAPALDRADAFYAAVKDYWPAVRREDLSPSYSGSGRSWVPKEPHPPISSCPVRTIIILAT